MYEEGILVSAQDTRTVIGLVLGDMLQNGVLLLQLSCTTGIVGHLSHQGNKWGWLCYWQFHHILHNLCPFRTTRNIEDDIDGSLGQDSPLVVTAQKLTAVSTFITVVFAIAKDRTNEGFQIPTATQGPRVTIEGAQTNEVTLATLMAQSLVHTEWQMDGCQVVVSIEDVGTKEMVHIHRILPITDTRRHQQVFPFTVHIVAGRPRTVTSRQPQ